MDTAELLRSFARDRSEDAFRQLVAVHIDLVYSAALRQVRNPAMADDVTQAVFMALARKAAELKPAVPLQAWLLKVTYFTALTTRKADERRLRHEREAAMNNPVSQSTSADPFDGIAEHVDEVLAELREADRNLIVLRFMQSMSLKQVAIAIGIKENTAGKRISRVLEKLRNRLARRGVALPAVTIGGLLKSHGIGHAPTALAGTVAHAAVAAQPWLSSGIGGGFFLTGLKTKAAVLIAAIVLLTGIVLWPFVWRAPIGGSSGNPTVGSPLPAGTSIPSPTTPALDQRAVRQVHPRFVVSPIPQATYFADPARNAFPGGMLMDVDEAGRPAGWQDLSAFDLGKAKVAVDFWSNSLYLTNDEAGQMVTVGAMLPVKKEWKRLAVRARVRGDKLEAESAEDAHAGVGFSFVDSGMNQIGMGTLLSPVVGRSAMMTTLEVPENAQWLLLSVEMLKTKGTLVAGPIVVMPVDDSKDPDPQQVLALHRAMRSGNVAKVKVMIAADKRLLESRSVEWNSGTPLIGAAWTDQGEMVSALLELGADAHAHDAAAIWPGQGWTASFAAAHWGNPRALAVLLKVPGEDVEELRQGWQSGLDTFQKGGRRAGKQYTQDYPACLELLNQAAATRPSTMPSPAPLQEILQTIQGAG